jgi:hypothetical protein
MKIRISLLLIAFTQFVVHQKAISQNSTKENYIDVSVNTFIPCANEYATGTVILHFFHVFNKSGNISKSHVQPQGGKIVGESTGTVYNTVGVSQSKETMVADGEAYTFSGIDNFHMVGTGKDGVKYKLHVNIHYTINANGELTANADNSSTTCE